MANNIDISIPFTNLSVDILKRYLEGRLSAKERTEVEKQLKEDPLAADALEGLRALENHDLLLTLAPAMQRDTRQMLARKRHKKFIGLSIRQYVMAAAVIIVVWLSFSIFKELGTKNTEKQIVSTNTVTDSQPIAQLQEKEGESLNPNLDTLIDTQLQKNKETIVSPTEQNPTGTITIIDYPASPENTAALQEEQQAIAENKIVRNEAATKTEDVKTANKPVTTTTASTKSGGGEMNSTKGGMTEPAKENVGSTKAGKTPLSPSPVPPTMPQKNIPPTSKTEKPTRAKTQDETKKEKDDIEADDEISSNAIQAPDVNMSAGMDDFRVGNYAKAAEAFNRIQPNSIFYPESRLRLGQSLSALQQYPMAINTFKNIGRKSPFYFESQWELAQVHLKKGEKDKAKKVLIQLSKEKNPYQNQALQKLVEIN